MNLLMTTKTKTEKHQNETNLKPKTRKSKIVENPEKKLHNRNAALVE